MKALALACLALLACATQPAAPQRSAAGPAVETPPPVTPRPTPLRILAGPRGTLLEVLQERDELRMDAEDPSGKIVASASLGSGVVVALARSPQRTYVLVTDDASHRLVALDDDLRVVATQRTSGAVPYADAAFRAVLEPGKQGVRVTYRTDCKEEESMGCVVFETYRLEGLAPLTTHSVPYRRMTSLKRPPPPIPKDQGDADVVPAPELPALDRQHGTLQTQDGRTAPCETRGSRLVDQALVGHKLYVLTQGCCGEDEHGGLFTCEVP